MITWFLNPKNLILTALAVLAVTVSGLYLWQRGALKDKDIVITRQTADIATMIKTNADLQGQVSDYKANLEAARKAQRSQQQIQTTTAAIRAEVQQIKTAVTMEESDEKIISDATYYFNSGGLRRESDTSAAGHPKTSGKVLPDAGASDPDRSGHWTVQQIISNYLELIDYALKMERTVECYGND